MPKREKIKKYVHFKIFTNRVGQQDIIISNAREDDCADDQYGEATHLQAISCHSVAFRRETKRNQFYQKDEVEGEENVFERGGCAIQFGFHPFS
jgi:hypothetical protein